MVLCYCVAFNSGAFNRTKSIQQCSVQPSQPSQLTQTIIRVHLCSFIRVHSWELVDNQRVRVIRVRKIDAELKRIGLYQACLQDFSLNTFFDCRPGSSTKVPDFNLLIIGIVKDTKSFGEVPEIGRLIFLTKAIHKIA